MFVETKSDMRFGWEWHVCILCNTSVDKFSAHDAFLEWLSSGSLKIERLENEII